MVLESECFHGVGAFEVHLLKVPALKLSHPSVCSVFQNFSRFSLLRHSLSGEKEGVKKLGPLGGTGISSKFYKCGHLEGEGNNALQLPTVIEIFHRAVQRKKVPL
jgi:hypothetical protein